MMTESPIIMTVDDSSSIRILVRQILERAGYVVCEAVDGADALQQLKGRHVDLVLADVNMPNMSGLQLVAHMRKMLRLRRVPVIYLTVEAGTASMRDPARIGGQAVLGKDHPLDAKALLATVEEVLKDAKLQP